MSGHYQDKMMRSDGGRLPAVGVVKCDMDGRWDALVLRRSDTFEQAEHEAVKRWGAGVLRRDDEGHFTFIRRDTDATD